jgi:hypothetical protein
LQPSLRFAEGEASERDAAATCLTWRAVAMIVCAVMNLTGQPHNNANAFGSRYFFSVL